MAMISVYAASKSSGCHPKRLRKLLYAFGYLDDEAMAATDAKALFDTRRDPGFLDRVATSMSLAQAREYLNVPRPHDRLLLEAGRIVPWVRGGTEVFKDHAFAKADLDRFLASLLAGAEPAHEDDSDLYTIPDAAKRADCSAMEIVALLLARRLVRRRLQAGVTGYLSLLVDPAEVAGHVRLPDHGGLSLRQVEKRMKFPTAVVKALVDGGHLVSRRVINPVKRQPQTVVDEDVVDAFMARYATASGLASERGIHPRAMASAVRGAGLQPVFPDIAYRIYDRTAVSAIG